VRVSGTWVRGLERFVLGCGGHWRRARCATWLGIAAPILNETESGFDLDWQGACVQGLLRLTLVLRTVVSSKASPT
jgi:hypothetical protein